MSSNAPKTVRELMQRARDAGWDSLGVANDPEAIDALWRTTVPTWLYGDETASLRPISPSLAVDDVDRWYFRDHIGTAAHGPYRTADEALSAAIAWRAL